MHHEFYYTVANVGALPETVRQGIQPDGNISRALKRGLRAVVGVIYWRCASCVSACASNNSVGFDPLDGINTASFERDAIFHFKGVCVCGLCGMIMVYTRWRSPRLAVISTVNLAFDTCCAVTPSHLLLPGAASSTRAGSRSYTRPQNLHVSAHRIVQLPSAELRRKGNHT
eukprot:COSAG02_NODE_15544_length_1161_cov_3.316667_2_plen_171_part_00